MFRYWSKPSQYVFLCCLFLYHPATASEPAEVEKKLERLRLEIRQIQKQLVDQRQRYGQTEQQTLAYERAISESNRKLLEHHKYYRALNDDIDDLQQQLKAGRERQQAIHLQLKEQLKNTHLQERFSFLIRDKDMDPDATTRLMLYHNWLINKRQQLLDELKHLDAKQQQQLKTLNAKKEQLNKTGKQLKDEKQQLGRKKADLNHFLAKLGRDLAQGEMRLQTSLQEQNQLQSLLDDLQKRLEELEIELDLDFRKLRGRLPWPAQGQVLHAFGQQKGKLKWQGWPIKVKNSSDIKAVAYGRVAFADWLRGYGLLMILDHGNGYLSLYAHNRELLHDLGEWIQAGEAIGKSPESSEIYFELRKDGKPLDPAAWLVSRN